MARFRYQAIDAGGRVVRGNMLASNQEQARESLRVQGLRAFKLKDRSGSVSAAYPLLRRLTLSRAHIDLALRDMSTVLGAGGTLPEAIHAASAQQSRASVRDLFDRIRSDIDRGCSLADSIAREPELFSPVCIGLVRAGEQSGSLAESLSEYASMSERWSKLRGKLVGALIYPCIVAATGVGVTVFLSISVLPSIADLLADTGRELPLVTRIVLGTTGFVAGWWWMCLAAAGIGGLALTQFMRRDGVRDCVDAMLLRIPALGNLLMTQEVVRASSVICGLLRGGLVLTDALDMAADTAVMRPVKSTLRESSRQIRSGQNAARVFETSTLPAVVSQVFAVGQRSGQLESMLERLASEYDQKLDRALQRVMTLAEPLLILILALLVGTVAMAVLLPILEAGDVL